MFLKKCSFNDFMLKILISVQQHRLFIMLIDANAVDGIKCYDTVKRPGGVLVVHRTVIKTPDTQTALCALAEAHGSWARQPSLTSL